MLIIVKEISDLIIILGIAMYLRETNVDLLSSKQKVIRYMFIVGLVLSFFTSIYRWLF